VPWLLPQAAHTYIYMHTLPKLSGAQRADIVFLLFCSSFVSRSSTFTYGGKTVCLLVAWVRERFRAKSRLQTTPGAAYRQVWLTRMHWMREEVLKTRCTQSAPYAILSQPAAVGGWIGALTDFTVKSDAAMLCREFLSAHQVISHEGSQVATGSGPHSRSASADTRMSGQAPTPVVA